MKKSFLSALALASLTACQTVQIETKPVAEQMAPAPLPASMQIGQERKYLWNGEETSMKVTAVDGMWFSAKTANGTKYTDNRDFAMPGKSWDIPSRNSKGEIKLVGGDYKNFWPLEVGKTASYKVEIKNLTTGWQGTGTRNCEVDSQENITVKAGNFDTYKVTCTWGTGRFYTKRTWYYAPSVEQVVKFVSSGNSSSSFELATK
jgi:hypothetical protein